MAQKEKRWRKHPKGLAKVGVEGSNPFARSSRFSNLKFSTRRRRREPQVSWGFAALA